MPRRSNSPISGIGSFTKIAAGLLLPIIGSFFLGSYIDEYFGTSPWLMLLLLMIGIVSGFAWLFKSVTDKDDK